MGEAGLGLDGVPDGDGCPVEDDFAPAVKCGWFVAVEHRRAFNTERMDVVEALEMTLRRRIAAESKARVDAMMKCGRGAPLRDGTAVKKDCCFEISVLVSNCGRRRCSPRSPQFSQRRRKMHEREARQN